jgi:hypothetical protein
MARSRESFCGFVPSNYQVFADRDPSEAIDMNRARAVSAVVLVLAFGFLSSPGRQALAAESTDKTVTLEIHGMV